jgi:hypothetical protein
VRCIGSGSPVRGATATLFDVAGAVVVVVVDVVVEPANAPDAIRTFVLIPITITIARKRFISAT